MCKDDGFRKVTKHINFEKIYEKTPHVMVSISSLDAGSNDKIDKTIRVKVNAKNINPSGFDIEINTWLYSTICGIKVSWISFS